MNARAHDKYRELQLSPDRCRDITTFNKDADMEKDTLWFKPLFWKAGRLQDFHSALGVSNRGALEQTENYQNKGGQQQGPHG